MDWVEQADRFWASELGVAAHVLRTDGFHLCERVVAQLQVFCHPGYRRRGLAVEITGVELHAAVDHRLALLVPGC